MFWVCVPKNRKELEFKMSKFFINTEQINQNTICIKGQDVNHIKNVLRKKINDEIIICDAQESKDYFCKIVDIMDDEIVCEINKKIDNDVESNINVTIFQGLPKSDKMELVIQKAVELGAFEITPIEMKRCVVKLNEKEKNKKIERWQKISEVAAKQCGRGIIPQINNIISVKDVCNLCNKYDILLVAYENEKVNTLKKEIDNIKNTFMEKEINIGIVIGPEGGIDEKEIEILRESGAKIVTLGKRILRTETVALNIISIIMYEFEK